MKKLLFISLLFLVGVGGYGQNPETLQQDVPSGGKRTFLKLNALLLPGVGLETKLFNSVTFFNQIGAGWEFITATSKVNVYPIYTFDFRYYHNMKGRITRERKTQGYCANYIAWHNHITPFVTLVKGGGIRNLSYFSGVHYGIQRRFSKHWYFDGSVGAGLHHLTDFYPNFYIGLGYSL